jgi:hypothetical protein
LYTFTPYVRDPELQYNIGWSIIGVASFNISFNMLVVVYNGVKKIIYYVRIMFRKYRSKKSKTKKYALYK